MTPRCTSYVRITGILVLAALFCNYAFGAGVTIVTHGQQFGDTPNLAPWVSSMADDIISQQISGTATKYRVTVTSPDWLTIQAVSSNYSGTSPVSSSSGEIVIELDWSAIADAITFEASTADIARLIRNCLTNASFFPSLGRPAAELPIHLIGHSRGGSLVCQLADYLGTKGIWVNQVTMLDPHPADTGIDDLLFPLNLHENVVFADNYAQDLDWPDGKRVDGSYPRPMWWIPFVHLVGGYTFPTIASEHGDVHLWYYGSINASIPVSDGSGGTITSSMRNDTGWWLTEEQSGAKTGHYFSRLGGGTYAGGTRPGSYVPSSSPHREPWALDVSGAAVWDNIEIVDFETDRSVTQGANFAMVCQFFDANRDATITIGLDSDRNSYNGVAGSALLTKTTSSITGNELNQSVGTSGAGIGTYYVYAKISNGTHIRYYYSKARLTVNSAGTPPTAINLTCSASPTSGSPGFPFTVSGTATYNNSGGSVAVGTVTITVGGQTYTAAINNGGYSRSIYAPNSSDIYTVSASASDGVGLTGSASSSVTVTSNGSTTKYIINEYLTCKSVDTSDPYMYHDAIEAFGSDDGRFYVWWEMTSITDAHTLYMRLYRPDGTLYSQTDTVTFGQNGWTYDWWRGHWYWQINGYDIADLEGRWTVKLYVDGSYKRTVYFTLRYEFKEHRLCKDHQATTPFDPITQTSIFTQTDTKAETWCKLDKLSNPVEMKWLWYEPNGSNYFVSIYNSTDPNSQGYDFWDWFKFWGNINIQGNSAAIKCGNWHVDVYIKDAFGNWDKEYTDYFRIVENPNVAPSGTVVGAPAVAQETQTVALNANASDNTYLESVAVYWNDGTLHSNTWGNLNVSSAARTANIGPYSAGQQVEYWVTFVDTSGNSFEGAHYSFVVSPETVTIPSTPSGPTIGTMSVPLAFATGGSTASLRGAVEYQFSWGDGQLSSWSAATQSHVWTNAGTFVVAARARSQARPTRVSDLSGAHTVVISGPQLAVSKQGGNVVLSWPANAACFMLVSSTNLAPNTVWTPVSPMPTVVADKNVVTMAASSASMFYRLIACEDIVRSGMVWIPAGTFTMGDTFNEGSSDEVPTHEVYVSAFYMDRTEVAKALWDEVYQWATNRPTALRYGFDNAGSGKAGNHPVHTINWYDVVKWCNARSEWEGRTPVYYTDAAQTTVYRTGQVNIQNDWVKWNAGYRLPTEAEWEKAAQGGTAGHRFPWADSDAITHTRANYRSTTSYSYDASSTRGYHPDFQAGGEPYTSPVDYFAPNGYGLHDMAGNVWEWCWDWWGPYSSDLQSDPRGPSSGPSRVVRGGSWQDDAWYCRTGWRNIDNATSRGSRPGFRCVLPVDNTVLIPAGSFTMGDTFNEGSSDEVPTHEVFVSAFYMDRTEVTKALWDEVYQWATNRPAALRYGFDFAGSGKATNHPVHSINWYDTVKWCNARSEWEGRTPAYYTNASQTTVYRTGQVDVQNDWVKWNVGYRLPTEAEWEKAARGGTAGHRFPWADSDAIMHTRANYRSTTSYTYDTSSTPGYHPDFQAGGEPYTSPVDYFAPNGYGLHDMAGNVWEWCWDWWGSYSSDLQSDPRGPSSGPSRVVRGGSWQDDAWYCRTGWRNIDNATSRGNRPGFRCVLLPGQP